MLTTRSRRTPWVLLALLCLLFAGYVAVDAQADREALIAWETAHRINHAQESAGSLTWVHDPTARPLLLLALGVVAGIGAVKALRRSKPTALEAEFARFAAAQRDHERRVAQIVAETRLGADEALRRVA